MPHSKGLLYCLSIPDGNFQHLFFIGECRPFRGAAFTDSTITFSILREIVMVFRRSAGTGFSFSNAHADKNSFFLPFVSDNIPSKEFCQAEHATFLPHFCIFLHFFSLNTTHWQCGGQEFKSPILHHDFSGNSDELPFLLSFRPENRAQPLFSECNQRGAKTPSFSKIGRSSDFFRFRGGLDPLRF